jgi:hypothetical protein
MTANGIAIPTTGSARGAVKLAAGAITLVACLSATLALSPGSAPASSARATAVHDACSGPGSAKVPCYFSTPSANIRCLWTPSPNNVVCELLSSARAYRLRPTGGAKVVTVKLTHHGETLPSSQTIVFPGSLSCRDTRTTMTCNQDFGFGQFKLGSVGSPRFAG